MTWHRLRAGFCCFHVISDLYAQTAAPPLVWNGIGITREENHLISNNADSSALITLATTAACVLKRPLLQTPHLSFHRRNRSPRLQTKSRRQRPPSLLPPHARPPLLRVARRGMQWPQSDPSHSPKLRSRRRVGSQHTHSSWPTLSP